ncbi:MAG: hypothetical protein WAX44_03615 [Minisyncoccia bacterium]
MQSIKNSKIQFIPGLGEKPKNYKTLFKFLEVLDVDWNTEKISPKINKPDILIGFSMGAVLACEYAIKHRIDTLIICSLTPMVETLKNVIARNIIFIVGSKEIWIVKNTKRVRKTLKCKNSLIIVPNADHKIVGNYRYTLIQKIITLSK